MAIAAVLALEPQILLFDEATTDLDPLGREQVRSVIRKLKEQGRTIVIVDHEPEGLAPADRIVILEKGKVLASGERENILTDPELLRANGIRPPEMAELFKALGVNSKESTRSRLRAF